MKTRVRPPAPNGAGDQRKRKSVKRITRRWILNSFVVIVGIVLLIVVIAAIVIKQNYYNQVEQILLNQSDAVRTQLERAATDPSGQEFSGQVYDYVSDFAYRDRMELMIVDIDRIITATSSGFLPETKSMPDLDNALLDTSQPGRFTGKLGTNERIMAVSLLYSPPDQGGEESPMLALRLVTSLSRIDRQIVTLVAVIVLLGICALALVLFSSAYFLNSIIRPIGEMGDTTRLIAQGDFNTRLEVDTNDEISELAETINYMAGELQTAEKLKNDFISSVSHELRTPLTAIQGWAETLHGGDLDPALTQKGMDIISSETLRLSDMVEELLDFSRMQGGRFQIIKTRTDLVAELSEAVLMYTQKAQREDITLHYDEPEEVIIVNADKNRLRQVFINIIDNAIKYSDPGDAVEITLELLPKKVIITIADSGIGIDEKDLPQIKEKFYKPTGSTRRGSGIGLAVADEIIALHDGTLDIVSNQGKGTTIRLTLPIYNKQDDTPSLGVPSEGLEE